MIEQTNNNCVSNLIILKLDLYLLKNISQSSVPIVSSLLSGRNKTLFFNLIDEEEVKTISLSCKNKSPLDVGNIIYLENGFIVF